MTSNLNQDFSCCVYNGHYTLKKSSKLSVLFYLPQISPKQLNLWGCELSICILICDGLFSLGYIMAFFTAVCSSSFTFYIRLYQCFQGKFLECWLSNHFSFEDYYRGDAATVLSLCVPLMCSWKGKA